MTGGANLRCLIAHQTHHSDASAIRQTWDETNIWPFLTAQTPLASRHHALDGKESSTPVTLTSSSCRTRQWAIAPSAPSPSPSPRQWEEEASEGEGRAAAQQKQNTKTAASVSHSLPALPALLSLSLCDKATRASRFRALRQELDRLHDCARHDSHFRCRKAGKVSVQDGRRYLQLRPR